MGIEFLKKVAFRLLVVTFVFACIKLTFDVEEGMFSLKKTLFFYTTTVLLFLTTWELSDYLIKKNIKKFPLTSMDWMWGIRMICIILVIDLPLFAAVYYLSNFTFSEALGLKIQHSWTEFRTDILRASLIALTISVSNLYYFAGKVRKNLENKMLSLEKELSVSKYQNLKNQISPHFLFNSLNTLTSLMYEDRDLASDFTMRLASCYRYILDNQHEDLVGLDKELSFLDSFIFMMDVRHKDAIQIRIEIDLKVTQYVIPTLTLQMLLENSLKHNYFSTEKPLIVTISISVKGILVTNNLRARINDESSTKLGLENIRRRFSFYTKDPIYINQDIHSYSVLLPLLKYDIEKDVSKQAIIK